MASSTLPSRPHQDQDPLALVGLNTYRPMQVPMHHSQPSYLLGPAEQTAKKTTGGSAQRVDIKKGGTSLQQARRLSRSVCQPQLVPPTTPLQPELNLVSQAAPRDSPSVRACFQAMLDTPLTRDGRIHNDVSMNILLQ